MTNNLTPEQKAIGKANALAAIGGLETGPRGGHASRRDFLKAAAAAGPALGAVYFNYGSAEGMKPVRAAIIGTGNEGCDAMIRQHNRDYLDYIGYCDVRPWNQKRALDHFAKHPQYSKDDVAKLKQYASIKDVLDDPEVEVVVIALPLFLHAPVAIDAMKKGKHVFCEKLMAHTVAECKEMCRVAHETNRLLAIGHQRHYSALYDNANSIVQSGALGDIRHIRASWHRNNGQRRIKKNADGTLATESNGDYIYEKDDQGRFVYYDSWKPTYQDGDQSVDLSKVAYTALDGKTYGYDSVDQLVRWRLYNATGAGLMAELGSHQLDACSIFLGKKKPLAVTGVGGKFYYEDDREADDHVFVTFEFPARVDDQGKPIDLDQRVVVTYSSITTNAFELYGEVIMGTMGTMMVEQEYDIYLYKENDRNKPAGWQGRSTTIAVEKAGSKAALETSASTAGPSAAAAIGAMAGGDAYPPSRGYREELEHFCYCVRHGDASNYHADKEHQPRCRGEVAMADAIIALTSNLAMRHNQRIEFKPEWFDYQSPATPADLFPQGRVAKA